MYQFIFSAMKVLGVFLFSVFLTFSVISFTTGLPPQGVIHQKGAQEQFVWPGPMPKQLSKNSNLGKFA
jgi:hypothetical protein